MVAQPAISIIIPTHNRCAALRRTLDALATQRFSPAQVEVLVVADGCADQTAAMARSASTPFALQVIEQPAAGAAAARNRGAAAARSRLLLFLDDDVVPEPGLVGAHVQAHNAPDRVVVGPYPPGFRRTGFLQHDQDAWWLAHFAALCEPGHRFSYKDVLSGNLSLPAALFSRVGGFDADPIFAAHEDYELGIRLMQAGARLHCAPDALAYHHDELDFERALRRKRLEGRADGRLAQRYPDLIPSLPLAQVGPADAYALRALRFAAFQMPEAAATLSIGLRHALRLAERLRLRQRWAQLYDGLQRSWYWRGVADELQTRQAWGALLREGKARLQQPRHVVELDLRDGLEAVERRLDQERPLAARLRYGAQPVGSIPFRPGAEPLRGAHLRPCLASALAAPLIEALAAAGQTPGGSAGDREQLAQAVRAMAPSLGPLMPGQMWLEQYSQWSRLEWQMSADRLGRYGQQRTLVTAGQDTQ